MVICVKRCGCVIRHHNIVVYICAGEGESTLGKVVKRFFRRFFLFLLFWNQICTDLWRKYRTLLKIPSGGDLKERILIVFKSPCSQPSLGCNSLVGGGSWQRILLVKALQQLQLLHTFCHLGNSIFFRKSEWWNIIKKQHYKDSPGKSSSTTPTAPHFLSPSFPPSSAS